MLNRAQAVLAALAVALLLGLGSSWLISRHYVAKAAAAEVQATEAKGVRDAAIEQSKAKDQEIAAHAQTIVGLAEQVSQAKAEAARLRARAGIKPAIPGDPLDVQPSDGLVASLDVVIASQDRLIAEQGAQIKTLGERIQTGDAALQASMRQTRALEIALDAQKHATASSKWMGRFQGFAVGLAVGYVGGRF